jgi:hypothetical protein
MKRFTKTDLYLVDFNENLKLKNYHYILQIQRETVCRKVYGYVFYLKFY